MTPTETHAHAEIRLLAKAHADDEQSTPEGKARGRERYAQAEKLLPVGGRFAMSGYALGFELAANRAKREAVTA